jgi:acetyl-CoA/propionyl-CoA carboxylase biotin carboxyl carrier protein
MLRALGEFEIDGVKTLLGFHRALLSHPCFAAGGTCHGVVESEELVREAQELAGARQGALPPADGRQRERVLEVELDGRRFDVRLRVPEPPYAELQRRRRLRSAARVAAAGGRDAVVSPMQGTVLDVRVEERGEVRAGQVVCIVEAMKMENELVAHRDGIVTELSVQPGQPVKTGQVICVVVPEGDAAE